MSAVDLGPVVYEPPLTHSTPQEHWPRATALRTGPRWLRGRTRWHRVRSGLRRIDRDHASFQTWCGQLLYEDRVPDTADDLPKDGAPLCGTCEGRAAGAGHSTPLGIPPDVALRFSPERLTPPRWCPGGGPYGPARHLGKLAGQRVVRCGACGQLVRERNAYGWNANAGEPQRHEPGPGLVPGCPQHAWRHLVRTVEGVACACAGLERAA